MTVTNNSPVRTFYVGEKRWLKWSITDQLDGAQIASVAYTAESPVTMVASSDAIYTRVATNDSAKARFDFTSAVAETRYSITAAMTTDEGELIKETIIVVAKALPT